MKTEDLKNYIFEQLNETSDALKRKLLDARFKQSMRAHDAGFDISQENHKIFKKTGTFDPSLTAARDVMGNRAVKAGKSYLKTVNRINGLMGDGSPRTSTQESALNFINGLKRLTETSYKRATEYSKARGKQLTAASSASDSIKSEIDKRKLNGAPQEELAALSRDYKVSKDLVGKIGKKAIAGWLRTAEARKREAPPSIYYDPR